MAQKHIVGFRSSLLHNREFTIPEFSGVKLTHDLDYRGILYPEGTRGIVVHKHSDDAYEVEFAHPAFSVVTLRKADIEIA